MLPPNSGLPNTFGLYGACSMRTLLQSRSISSAMSSGMAVKTPWPISQAGAYTVTMLSVPTRTHPLGGNGGFWPTAFWSGAGLPNAIPTAVAPDEMRKARRDTPLKANPPKVGFISHLLGGALDGRDDLVVRAAAADVALHVLDDLRARRVLVLRQQAGRGHDLAG